MEYTMNQENIIEKIKKLLEINRAGDNKGKEFAILENNMIA